MVAIKDSVAVITGGASGIGLALAQYWLENEGKVVIGDVVASALEQAAKELKGDLAIRPIHHQLEERIKAHIFISFLAYCLHVTLHRRLRDLAPGLTPRAVLEKFATMQMLDVHLPTTDERTVVLSRYTQPETDVQLLLQRLKLELPAQPPPKITRPNPPTKTPL